MIRFYTVRRFLSTDKRKKDKPFEYSVNLPRTSFPMRANAVVNEVKFRDRCMDALYKAQV